MMLTPTYDILGDQLNGELSARLENDFFDYVTAEASQIPVRESDLVFTDYHNGRRTPDADFSLKASAHGFGLSTRAGHFFKALVEATAFGSRAIMERFLEYRIPIETVIASGGIPNKSPYVVQVLADVLGVDIQVTDSDQTCALGSAVFAAVATGVYPDIESAQKVIAAKRVKTCKPDPERGKVYETLYKTYLELTRLRK